MPPEAPGWNSSTLYRQDDFIVVTTYAAERPAVAPYSSAQQTFINIIHQYENIKVPYFHGALWDHF